MVPRRIGWDGMRVASIPLRGHGQQRTVGKVFVEHDCVVTRRRRRRRIRRCLVVGVDVFAHYEATREAHGQHVERCPGHDVRRPRTAQSFLFVAVLENRSDATNASQKIYM